MNSEEGKQANRRPRVVQPPDDYAEPGSEADDFRYFALKGPEQLKEISKQIEAREKIHLELVMMREALEGAPEGIAEHQEDRTTDSGTRIPCQCNNCELDRINRLIPGQEYGIRKLRALYSRFS